MHEVERRDFPKMPYTRDELSGFQVLFDSGSPFSAWSINEEDANELGPGQIHRTVGDHPLPDFGTRRMILKLPGQQAISYPFKLIRENELIVVGNDMMQNDEFPFTCCVACGEIGRKGEMKKMVHLQPNAGARPNE